MAGPNGPNLNPVAGQVFTYNGPTNQESWEYVPPPPALVNGTSPDAGVLTGAEIVPATRQAGLLQTTVTSIARFVTQVYLAFTQAGTGAVARTIVAKMFDIPVNVKDFGAVDAITSPGTSARVAFQNALNAVAALGGGIVEVPCLPYYFGPTDVLTIPANVTLKGKATGPFEAYGVNPSTTAIAPTLLVTNTSGTFLTLSGTGSKVTDVLFYYPNQVGPTVATPIAYPYTITVTQGRGSNVIARVTAVNAYSFLDIESGRVTVEDVLIGAFQNDIKIDHALDWVELINVKCQVMWDIFAGLPFPQTVDAWVLTNGDALRTYRIDSLQAVNFSVYGRFRGHVCDDSSDGSQSPTCGYGRFSNVDFDTVAFGVLARSANASAGGFKYANIDVGSNGTGSGIAGQSPVELVTGGSQAPVISVDAGSFRGTWAAGSQPVSVSAGKAYVRNVRAYNPFGALTAPTVPSSGTVVTNTYPFDVRVFIAGGAVSNVNINGSGAGNASGMYLLAPYETIAVTYSSTPAWAWFGM